jgi:hypothetical protein
MFTHKLFSICEAIYSFYPEHTLSLGSVTSFLLDVKHVNIFNLMSEHTLPQGSLTSFLPDLRSAFTANVEDGYSPMRFLIASTGSAYFIAANIGDGHGHPGQYLVGHK